MGIETRKQLTSSEMDNGIAVAQGALSASDSPLEKFNDRFPLGVIKAIRKGSLDLSEIDKKVIEVIVSTDWAKEALKLSDPEHREIAASAIAIGATICYGFGNFYAVAGHPCWESVRHVNLAKGRPEDQTGSITTTKKYFPEMFDWTKLPEGLERDKILKMMDEFYEIGPFGFRGPAEPGIPAHLSSEDNGIRVTQIIAPGYSCESNDILERSISKIDEKYLFITSANISHHVKGTIEEPAHYKIKGIQNEFGRKAGFFMVAHENEGETQKKYPKHEPTSTSILSFHKLGYDENGKPSLILERHGSLDFEDVLGIVKGYNLGLVKSSKAQTKLPTRSYSD